MKKFKFITDLSHGSTDKYTVTDSLITKNTNGTWDPLVSKDSIPQSEWSYCQLKMRVNAGNNPNWHIGLANGNIRCQNCITTDNGAISYYLGGNLIFINGGSQIDTKTRWAVGQTL